MRWVAALALGLLAGCAERKQVWFTPDLASADMADLFARPEQWEEARASVDVFKFYESQVRYERPEECPRCGPNILPAFQRVDAFRRLGAWRIDIALEAGAIKDFDCEGSFLSEVLERAIRNVHLNGGIVRYVSLDNPMEAILTCRLSLPEAAARVAAFAQRASALSPVLRVGESEPYPLFDLAQLTEWVAALQANGHTPAFLHLDVDRPYAAELASDVPGDLAALRSFCDSQDIRFGILFWGNDASSDRAYYESVIGWTQSVASTLGRPTHSVFQSFAVAPDGQFNVPRNLPESEPYTHTRLISEGLRILPRD